MSARSYTTSFDNAYRSSRGDYSDRHSRSASSRQNSRGFSDAQRTQRNERAQRTPGNTRAHQRYESADNSTEQDRSTPIASLFARMSRLRRTRNKEKAGRLFDRQYAQDSDMQSFDSLRDNQAVQPRAALYKGEMGSSHRRAARMQTSSRNNTFKQAARTTYRDESSQRRHRFPRRWQVISIVVVAFLVVGCAFLYEPAQQYYQQIRERDRLQAEYEAVQERNDYIQTQINALSTDEGVADKARADLGWIEPGETLGTVSGLDADDYTDFVANIVPGSIEAPETWYSGFLDPFFGVGGDS